VTEPGHQCLAGRTGEIAPSIQAHDLRAVDREVERLPDSDVIEGRQMRVERDEVDQQPGVLVDLTRDGQPQRVQLCGGQ
jgi:hypothetical protein